MVTIVDHQSLFYVFKIAWTRCNQSTALVVAKMLGGLYACAC